jgi:hypothetical protein
MTCKTHSVAPTNVDVSTPEDTCLDFESRRLHFLVWQVVGGVVPRLSGSCVEGQIH